MIAESLLIKQKALDDVRDISGYIASDRPRSAENFRVEFKQAIERIRTFPQTGHHAARANPDIRLMRVSSRFRRYLIVYILLDGPQIKIVRVLHSAMDIASELSKLELD